MAAHGLGAADVRLNVSDLADYARAEPAVGGTGLFNSPSDFQSCWQSALSQKIGPG